LGRGKAEKGKLVRRTRQSPPREKKGVFPAPRRVERRVLGKLEGGNDGKKILPAYHIGTLETKTIEGGKKLEKSENWKCGVGERKKVGTKKIPRAGDSPLVTRFIRPQNPCVSFNLSRR